MGPNPERFILSASSVSAVLSMRATGMSERMMKLIICDDERKRGEKY
jgi:hypothetical protein